MFPQSQNKADGTHNNDDQQVCELRSCGIITKTNPQEFVIKERGEFKFRRSGRARYKVQPQLVSRTIKSARTPRGS